MNSSKLIVVAVFSFSTFCEVTKAPLASMTESFVTTGSSFLPLTGEVGVISSVTQAFCSDCNRARLSTEGKLFTCLFATGGHDLRALLRKDHSDEEITAAIAHLWAQREDRYSELRTQQTEGLERPVRKVEMSYIGG